MMRGWIRSRVTIRPCTKLPTHSCALRNACRTSNGCCVGSTTVLVDKPLYQAGTSHMRASDIARLTQPLPGGPDRSGRAPAAALGVEIPAWDTLEERIFADLT